MDDYGLYNSPLDRMRRNCTSKTILCQVLTALAFSLAWPGFGQRYTITDLNAPGDSYRLAYGINTAGDVVGEYEPTNVITVHAFWYHDGTTTDLGVLPGYVDAYAYAINDGGQIAGWCDVYAGTERAFRYSSGTLEDLGTLGTFPTGGWSEAYAINLAGQVVGTATLTPSSVYHAVLWGATFGTKQDLGSLAGPSYNSTAYGLNNLGVIVGESQVTNSVNDHAFSYSNNIMTDLGTLPGGSYSHANAVNDSGVIVGESDTAVAVGTAVHAFVCPNGPGSLQDLGTLGGRVSSAYAINSAGLVVGYAVNSSNVSRAFLYNGSKMLDLNDLILPASGWTNLEAAVGINDSGQIAGYGQFAGGRYHAFLLIPAGPLTVAITNPTPGAVFTAPATFVVAASTSDSAGTVTNVEFLVNGSMIGEATSAPYSATATDLATGSYTLSAVASDNMGLRATNSFNISVINGPPAPVTISDATFTAGSLSFSFGTQTGYTYTCQYTTPLSLSNNWVAFTNLPGTGSSVTVTDSTATDNERYYRVFAQ